MTYYETLQQMKSKLCGTDCRRVATEANVTLQTVRNTFKVQCATDHTEKQVEILNIARKLIAQKERAAKRLEKQLQQTLQQ
jgi:hypothetical protein